MDLVVAGHPNKVVANRLGIAVRTVEIHRARVMDKTEARNLSELIRMAILLEQNRLRNRLEALRQRDQRSSAGAYSGYPLAVTHDFALLAPCPALRRGCASHGARRSVAGFIQ